MHLHDRRLGNVLQTSECSAGKDRIEQLLALGATRWEATQASLQRCARVALTPILNQMNVVGIVSIPGEHAIICIHVVSHSKKHNKLQREN